MGCTRLSMIEDEFLIAKNAKVREGRQGIQAQAFSFALPLRPSRPFASLAIKLAFIGRPTVQNSHLA